MWVHPSAGYLQFLRLLLANHLMENDIVNCNGHSTQLT